MLKIISWTTIGRDHLKTQNVLIGKQNQDSVHHKTNNGLTVGVICDGCSEGVYNKFGSLISITREYTDSSKFIDSNSNILLNGNEIFIINKKDISKLIIL